MSWYAKDASDDRPTVVMIVPEGSTNSRGGGGQRTALFFDALRGIGCVRVLIVGSTSGPIPATFFSGAESVIGIQNQNFSIGKTSGLKRRLSKILDLLNPSRIFRVDNSLKANIESAIADLGTPIIVFRYAKTFSRSGLYESKGDRLIMVDVDDSDDKKLFTQFATRIGPFLTEWLLGPALLTRVKRELSKSLSRADQIWYANPNDVLTNLGVASHVAPNVPYGRVDPSTLSDAGRAKDVLFVGQFDHNPNKRGMVWFMRRCWKDISRVHPEAHLRIVGMGDWKSLKPVFPNLERVDYVGSVDNLGAEYARALVVVAPIFEGGGSQIKVIEACSFARPIVCTSFAASGFGSELGNHLSTADTASEMIDACKSFLMDAEAATSKGNALREAQYTHFSRETALSQIRANILERLEKLV